MEKVVTKCLCKVLEGLSLNDQIQLPDAIDLIEQKAKEKEASNPERGQNEFSALLDELVSLAKAEKGDADMQSDEGSSDDEDEVDAHEEHKVVDVIQTDKEMRQEDIDLQRKVQLKLQRKVLPVLQRHLFEPAKT